MNKQNEPALILRAACDGITNDEPLLVRLMGEAARRRQRIGGPRYENTEKPQVSSISKGEIA